MGHLAGDRTVSIVLNPKIEEVGPVDLKPGSRCKSVVDTTEVMVIRAPAHPVDLRCGGHPMVPLGAGAPAMEAADPGHSSGTPLGKRYADDASGLEVLCTKARCGVPRDRRGAAAAEGRQGPALLGLTGFDVHLSMLLDMAAEGFGDRVAFGSRDGGLTYAALRDRARRAAAWAASA